METASKDKAKKRPKYSQQHKPYKTAQEIILSTLQASLVRTSVYIDFDIALSIHIFSNFMLSSLFLFLSLSPSLGEREAALLNLRFYYLAKYLEHIYMKETEDVAKLI